MASGELRRRNAGRTAGAVVEEPEFIESTYSDDEEAEEAYRQGLELYNQAEQSEFQDTDALTKSIRHMVRATEMGVERGSDWMKEKDLLNPASAQPYSAAIPEDLRSAMKRVTEASPEERKVSFAARSMFQKMTGGHGAIPKKEISQKAKDFLESDDVANLQKSPYYGHMIENSIHRLVNDAREINEADEITEDAFVEAATTYARGEIGTAQGEVSGLTDEQRIEFQKANIVKKLSDHPKQTLYYLKNMTLKRIERNGVRWLWSYIPTKQFYWLLAIYIVPMLTFDLIISLIFSVVVVAAFIAMVVATMQMAANSVGAVMQQQFMSLFDYFSKGSKNKIDPTISRSKLITRSMVPYLTFFIAMVVAVLSLRMAHRVPYDHEFLAVLSGFFATGVFVQFEIYSEPLLLVSLATRMVSWVYAFLVMINQIFPMSSLLSLVEKSVISIPFFGGFTFTVNLMSFLQFPLHLSVIFYLLYTKTWQNIFTGLGPYAVCICWFVLCRSLFSSSSPENLMSAGVTMLAVVGGIPFFPLIFLVSPVFVAYYYGLMSLEFFVSVAVVVLASVVVVIIAANFQKIKEAKWLNIPIDYFPLLLILLTIPGVILGSNLYARRHDQEKLDVVTLEQYTEYCGPSNWLGGNMVQTQLNCLHLQDRTFESSATVKSVRISEITDSRGASLASFPTSIKTSLTCLLGEKEPMCGNRENMTTCVRSKCNFQHSYFFTFEIKLEMPLASEGENISVLLMAANKFRKTILNLTAGMNIRFNAMFVSGMGSDKVELKAVSLSFPDSAGGDSSLEDEEEWDGAVEDLLWKVGRSLKDALFFVLEVLVGYTPTQVHKH